ncbi:GlxD: glutamate synthase large subunit-like protein [Desulfosarcina variabilis str. Montpellier]|uniref:glutamate synthase-related protein n=1 Tax=Desulfosarcina variabilis TaxID=2300 RepID=UPI003AFB68A3
MATIDLSIMPMKTANEVIKGYGAIHQDITILNPDAKHYLAAGLTNPIAIEICGSAGYFCGGLSDSPRIHVQKNVSWGVGDNMLSGSIIVDGNAGAIAGEALRGGEIVIKGNMGSRAGQVMKKGTLCCAGNASFMAGYMMYGGRLIILGDSGERVGENMAGGEIFVGGAIDSLGCDAMVVDATGADIESIRAFLERYGIDFNGTFKKVVSAGNDLKYGKPEPKTTRMPFTVFSGSATPYWNEKVQQDIRVKSDIGRYRIRGYGTTRHVPHFGDLAFKTDIARALADVQDFPSVSLRTLIGDRHGARAIDLSMPVMIAPMSYGALSAGMKQALGLASHLSGIADNTGEGGMYSVERAEARQLIAQCLSGRLGWNIHDMKRADALELYISQGAKPGLGGQLMASKLTEEIAAMRGIPAGMDLRSPSRHPDILGGDDLIMKVQEFKEAVGGRLPVSLKLGGGRTRDDVKIAYKDGLDFIALDGSQGGTGAAGDEVAEYVGIPSMAALMEAVDGLEEIDAGGQLPIVLMGGIQDGIDVAKAIALGASAVAIGTGMLVAGGCTGCMECSSGNCPIGMATQNESLTRNLDVRKVALKMHAYLESIRWQLSAIATALGYNDIRQLSRDDLVALTPEAAALTRLPYCPEYREQLLASPAIDSKSNRETGSANFTRRDRRAIREMAAIEAHDTPTQKRLLDSLLVPRDNPFPESRAASLDDVVFLSAALTRLVIDPYREACSTSTAISRWMEIGRRPDEIPCLTLAEPFLITGFDDAPEPVRQGLAAGLAAKGCGYVGRRPLVREDEKAPDAKRVKWLQLIQDGDEPDMTADGLIFSGDGNLSQKTIRRRWDDQLLGITVSANTVCTVLPFALENELDFLVLDGTAGIATPWAELQGAPDLTLWRDTIALLRQMGREEEIALISFGGIRSGTDVAKALAINCHAALFSVAPALAMGGVIEDGRMVFADDTQPDQIAAAVENWIQATSQETAIIARCTGKTSVHNLEPEDMRCISIAAAKATGIGLASGAEKREGF